MPRELMSLLERLCRDAPVVLVFEDLQWADPFTVALLEVLARARAPVQLMLVGTYRAGDLAPGEHSLRALRQELQLHGLCRELRLQLLTEREITAYLSAGLCTGDSPPEGLASLLHRHTEGNPLFMVTLLEHLCQRGLLARLNWQLQAPLDTIEFEVPETLREMIDARVARLSADEQHLLEVASIIGIEFSPQSCADCAGRDPEHTEALCRALAERHCILRRSQNDPSDHPPGNDETRYEFVHAMYREVLYRRQPAGRRAGLHLKVARSLKSASAALTPELAHVLAHHFERGGRPQEVKRYRELVHEPEHRPPPRSTLALPASTERTRAREVGHNCALA